MHISMLTIDPTDQDDALEALGLVDDLNGLIDEELIKVEVDLDGTPRLYPTKGHDGWI